MKERKSIQFLDWWAPLLFGIRKHHEEPTQITPGLRGIIKGNKGQTLVEYALILLLVVLVAILAVSFFGNRLATLLQSVVAVF